MRKLELAEFTSQTSVIWKPIIYSCLEQIKAKKPVTVPTIRKYKSDQTDLLNQSMIVRSRFSIGMYSKNISEPVKVQPEEMIFESNSSSFCLYNMTENTEEDVIVGKVALIDMPCFENITQNSLNSIESDMLSIPKPSIHSLRSKSYNKTRPQFSIKNPHSTNKLMGVRANLKAFLAPPDHNSSDLGLSLSLEQGPPKVLLVDDNSLQRGELKEKLTVACGWEPDIACNGVEAVQKFKYYASLNFKYTAIFMDLTMPEMDGITATKRIRSLELTNNYSPTRIIGLQGLYETESEEKCKSVGMNSLSKF